MRFLRWALYSGIIVAVALFNMVIAYAVLGQVSVVTWFPAWSALTFVTTIIVLWLAESN